MGLPWAEPCSLAPGALCGGVPSCTHMGMCGPQALPSAPPTCGLLHPARGPGCPRCTSAVSRCCSHHGEGGSQAEVCPCPTEPLGEEEGDGPMEGSEAAADEDRLDSLEAPEAAEGEFSLCQAVPGCAVPGCAWPWGCRAVRPKGAALAMQGLCAMLRTPWCPCG